MLEDKIGDVGIGLVGRGDNGGCGAVVLAVTTVNRLCGGALTEVVVVGGGVVVLVVLPPSRVVRRRRARGTLAERSSVELGGERRALSWPLTRCRRRGVASELLPVSSSWLPVHGEIPIGAGGQGGGARPLVRAGTPAAGENGRTLLLPPCGGRGPAWARRQSSCASSTPPPTAPGSAASSPPFPSSGIRLVLASPGQRQWPLLLGAGWVSWQAEGRRRKEERRRR
jgi:hypothetical protein